MQETKDHEKHKHDEVGRLEQQVRHRIAACQRDIGSRQSDRLKEHGQYRHLRHSYHRQELRAEEQRNEDRQENNQSHQHRRHNKQRHLHLLVHRLIGRYHVSINSRETRKIVGLHRREHHAGISDGYHISSIIETQHIEVCRHIQPRADKHLRTRADDPRQRKCHSQAHHLHSLAEDSFLTPQL